MWYERTLPARTRVFSNTGLIMSRILLKGSRRYHDSPSAAIAPTDDTRMLHGTCCPEPVCCDSDGLVTKLRLKSPSKTEPRRSERIFVTRRAAERPQPRSFQTEHLYRSHGHRF